MVRITGSVKEENSLGSPPGGLLSWVVRRSNGKSAKRMRGTESRAPTKTEPSPSDIPRNERLLSRDTPSGLDSGSVAFLESPRNMKALLYLNRAAEKYGAPC